ncbi:MAG: response regulator transcription factor [Dactylosporangium sp.]|nr:response regulator transcription factor [Dactylosporangium sp.]NNJ59424.1 response regulator transcription factor [Dactylosporangium sp.]
MTSPARIRVAIVDDQEMVRTGLRMILRQAPDLLVVGEAADGAEAVSMAARVAPAVILMDIRLPVCDGIEATRRIRAVAAGAVPRILILTTFDLDEYVYAALEAGASGFILKDVLARDLHAAVRTVHAGDAVTAPAVTRRLIAHFAGGTGPPPAPRDDIRLDPLTTREREVLTLIAGGMTNTEIAARLSLSRGTVKTHVSHVLAKLGLRDRVQAVICGYQTGLVQPDRQPPIGP